MRTAFALMAAFLLCVPAVSRAQDGRAALEGVAKAPGADTLHTAVGHGH